MSKKKPEWLSDFKPKLYDYQGDWSKRWFIKYKVYHTDKKEFVFRKIWIPSVMPVSERRTVAGQIMRDLKTKLNAGYHVSDNKITHHTGRNLVLFVTATLGMS
jgi:hypothetical protein